MLSFSILRCIVQDTCMPTETMIKYDYFIDYLFLLGMPKTFIFNSTYLLEIKSALIQAAFNYPLTHSLTLQQNLQDFYCLALTLSSEIAAFEIKNYEQQIINFIFLFFKNLWLLNKSMNNFSALKSDYLGKIEAFKKVTSYIRLQLLTWFK